MKLAFHWLYTFVVCCCWWWFHWFFTICNTFCCNRLFFSLLLQLHDLSLYSCYALFTDLFLFHSIYLLYVLLLLSVVKVVTVFILLSNEWKEHCLIDSKRKTNPKNKTIVNINELTQEEMKKKTLFNWILWHYGSWSQSMQNKKTKLQWMERKKWNKFTINVYLPIYTSVTRLCFFLLLYVLFVFESFLNWNKGKIRINFNLFL